MVEDIKETEGSGVTAGPGNVENQGASMSS